MTMTRKHFEAVAGIIKDNLDPTTPFAAENPRFDSTRFLIACGVLSDRAWFLADDNNGNRHPSDQ